MITGSSAWNAALASNVALADCYSFEVPSQSLVCASFNKTLVSGMPSGTIDVLAIPNAGSQKVDELSGHSDISGFEVECIDPGGIIKGKIAANPDAFIGAQALFKMGFSGLAYSDMVTLHTMQISNRPDWTTSGIIRLKLDDPLRYQVAKVFAFGGPAWYAPGLPTPLQPVGPSWATNGQAISSENPLYLQGNPIDLFLAVCQNFLGMGQTANTPQSSWTMYQPGDISTLINPNPLLDVTGILTLKTAYFSGDWMEFRLTDSVPDGKSWLEREILQPLCCYTIVRSTGQLSLKYAHAPLSQSAVATITNASIFGIPEIKPLEIVNVVTFRVDSDNQGDSTNSATYKTTFPYWSQASISAYQRQFTKQVESRGLISARGGLARAQLYANRTFARHAFGVPAYDVKASLSFIGLELGDLVNLTHPSVFDYKTGTRGLTNVLCEVIDRTPQYADGAMKVSLMDTRFIGLTSPWLIAPSTEAVWPGTTGNTDYFIVPQGGTSTAPTPANYSPGGQPYRNIF